MLLAIFYTLLMVAALTRGKSIEVERDEPKGESFDSPVYTTLGNSFRPAVENRKSAYNVPTPVSPALLASVPYSLPYAYDPYSQYGTIPYPVPPTYGTLFNNPAFVSALMSRSGYEGYGRTVYPAFEYGLPNYFSGLSYPTAAIRRGPSPIASAPFFGMPRPEPPVAIAPSGRAIPAAISAFPNVVPVAAAPFAGVPPYRVSYPEVQNKDGTKSYAPATLNRLY